MTTDQHSEQTGLPWRIERDPKHAEYATVYDSTGSCVPILTDIQLGWTDKTTGPYADPEKDFALLNSLVGAVNERPDLLARIKRLEGVAKMIDAWGNGLRRPTEHEAKMVKAARAALTE